MTWKEFKAEVDRQLEEQGISQDVKMAYIDHNFIWEVKAGLVEGEQNLCIT